MAAANVRLTDQARTYLQRSLECATKEAAWRWADMAMDATTCPYASAILAEAIGDRNGWPRATAVLAIL